MFCEFISQTCRTNQRVSERKRLPRRRTESRKLTRLCTNEKERAQTSLESLQAWRLRCLRRFACSKICCSFASSSSSFSSSSSTSDSITSRRQAKYGSRSLTNSLTISPNALGSDGLPDSNKDHDRSALCGVGDEASKKSTARSQTVWRVAQGLELGENFRP